MRYRKDHDILIYFKIHKLKINFPLLKSNLASEVNTSTEFHISFFFQHNLLNLTSYAHFKNK